MKTGFRVDALSSCLNNVANPGFDLDDKGNVMRKYLFVSESLYQNFIHETQLNLKTNSDLNSYPDSI